MTFHAMRHTAATWLPSKRTEVKTVQSILGHSAASTTLNIYGRLVPQLQREAVEGIHTDLQAAMDRLKARTGT
ncbi:MAG: tyrosine-type recombinase/integrase [bacterium]|nr:tyrosine-type recombinase/integrase [bacterium]